MVDRIEWIFFDVGSTLIDEKMVYHHRIKEMSNETNVSYEELYEKMIEFYKQNKKGDLEIAKEMGIDVPKWDVKYETLYPEAKSCLKELANKYKIGIIANQLLGIENRLKDNGILEYIDLVISSAEEGVSKPDLKIFNLALERANCLPQKAIMVGDRLDNDIAPAKALGMKTIWIKQGFAKFYSPKNEKEYADLVVGNLNEIKSILCKDIKNMEDKVDNRNFSRLE